MPEAKNLLTIFSACEEEDFEKTFDKFKGKNFSELKRDLTEVLINKIGPKNILQNMAPQAAGTGLRGRGGSN